ncbi:YraN family protein [Candidatus Daviesbacteria bacterium]|nr:YraN family protein [Candidatus Daviesbacteria bacterium]
MLGKQTGSYGEELACKYLKKQGYKILQRNFRIRGGEIDIVAKDPAPDGVGQTVFVEVKTRSSHEYGDPAEAITPWKIRFLIRAAQFYLLKNKLTDKPYRIDAVTVDFTNGERIEHFKNITF